MSLSEILQALESGVPLDHGNRTDTRITILEAAVKAILQTVVGEKPAERDESPKPKATP